MSMKKRVVRYMNLLSAVQPSHHSNSLKHPPPNQNYELDVENEDSVEEEESNQSWTSDNPDFEEKDDQSHRLSQSELNDEDKAELLWNHGMKESLNFIDQ